MTFDTLGLSADLLRTVDRGGLHGPDARPGRRSPSSSQGRDVLAAAQTGTGKTAAFALPILDRLRHAREHLASRRPATRSASLILVPTRELAMQVDESVRTYGRTVPLRSTVVYGGIPMDPQIKALRGGVEILVATPGPPARPRRPEGRQPRPGRDPRPRRGRPDARHGLPARHPARSSRCCPAKRQNLMFSATFSDDIRRLSGTILRDPATVEVAPRNTAAEAVRQLVYPVDRDRKEALLAHLIRKDDLRQVLVFTRTKLAASRLASWLDRAGLDAVAIHCDRSQPERTRALEGFKTGEIRVLVATDVAARGLDIEDLPARRELRAAVEPAGLHPPDRADGPGRGRRARRSASSASTRPISCAASSGCSARRSRGPSRRASSRTGTPSRDRSGCAAGHAAASRPASRPPQAGPSSARRREARRRPRDAGSGGCGVRGPSRTAPGK